MKQAVGKAIIQINKDRVMGWTFEKVKDALQHRPITVVFSALDGKDNFVHKFRESDVLGMRLTQLKTVEGAAATELPSMGLDLPSPSMRAAGQSPAAQPDPTDGETDWSIGEEACVRDGAELEIDVLALYSPPAESMQHQGGMAGIGEQQQQQQQSALAGIGEQQQEGGLAARDEEASHEEWSADESDE